MLLNARFLPSFLCPIKAIITLQWVTNNNTHQQNVIPAIIEIAGIVDCSHGSIKL